MEAFQAIKDTDLAAYREKSLFILSTMLLRTFLSLAFDESNMISQLGLSASHRRANHSDTSGLTCRYSS